MITCDGARFRQHFAFVSVKRRGPTAYLHLEQIYAECDTWQEMKAAAAKADTKKASQDFAEKYKVASGMAKKSDDVAASLAKVLADWIAAQ
jgi:hypothetical protein